MTHEARKKLEATQAKYRALRNDMHNARTSAELNELIEDARELQDYALDLRLGIKQ